MLRLEAERMEELREKMEVEKAEALRLQWEEAEKQKAEAVEEACDALTKKLNKEHRLDKELSIGNALQKARVSRDRCGFFYSAVSTSTVHLFGIINGRHGVSW